MKTILNNIADHAKKRVENSKSIINAEEMKERALSLPKGNNAFSCQLKKEGMSFICEIKKASPSKGIIDPEFAYKKIAEEYVSAGADCISCLTEPKWFLGSDKIFADVRQISAVPLLRKDFIVDEYQIYESKCMGADCVLLICALLDRITLQKYLSVCGKLGLDALVETHSAAEIDEALSAGAQIIGVNNRNLHDFNVDLNVAKDLRSSVPKDKIFVAESGINCTEDVKTFAQTGADAVLIGELMMKSKNKKNLFADLKKAAQQ